MAPKINARRVVLSLCLLLLVVAAFFPQSASASRLADAPAIPDLPTFTASVVNGIPRLVSGVYAEGLFALPVVQQPASSPGYVSRADNSVTQFGMASQFGNIGLLAHNNLSGQYFFQFYSGQRIFLVYGDGRLEPYQVTRVYRYQATDPFSVYSYFIDLDTQEHLSASELFVKVYQGSKHVTFQTCIDNNGNSSWGRLFVIAEPAAVAGLRKFGFPKLARAM